MRTIILILVLGCFSSTFCQGPYLVYGPSGGEHGSIYSKPSQGYPPPAPAPNQQPDYAEPAIPPSMQQDQYEMTAMNESSEVPQSEILTIDPRDPDGDSIIGIAGQDYPILSEIPRTGFQCPQQQYPGYYADQEAFCQVFHICLDDGRNHSFLCPNGTLFNQEHLVCDWWYNVNCSLASSYFDTNIIFAPPTTESVTMEESNMTVTNDTNVTDKPTMAPSQPTSTWPPLLMIPPQASYAPAPQPGQVYMNYGTRYSKPQYSQFQHFYQRPDDEWGYSQFFNPDPEFEVSVH